MQRLSGLVFLVFALVLAVGCAPTTPANADNGDGGDDNAVNDDEPAASFETYFTYPQPGEPDGTIEDRVVELLEATPEGATVRAAFYTFSLDRIAETIGDAHDRGVDIRVVLGNTNVNDDGSSWEAVQRLRARIGDRLTVCDEGEEDGGCMAENIHHNKFMAISDLEGPTEDVVVQTSANITHHSRTDQYNNMVVVHGDTGLYEAMTSYWDDLRSDETTPDYNRSEEGDANTTVYFFPLSEGDPIQKALREVDCQTGGEVYLAVAFFTDSRADIAHRLDEMDQVGCDVHAMIAEDEWSDSPGDEVLSVLQSGDIELGLFGEDAAIQLHSKYLAVEDTRPDADDRHVVWTGSPNYSWSGLRNNDEVLLEIADQGVYEDYREDWQQIRPNADTLHP